MTNCPALDDLPSHVVANLDSEFVEYYCKLAPEQAADIAALVKKAKHLNVKPGRVVRYAALYSIARRVTLGDEVSREHTIRAKTELAGMLHGISDEDPEGARRAYRGGRQVIHQISVSLQSVLDKWKRYEQAVKKYRSRLPRHVQSRFSDSVLSNVRSALQPMGLVLAQDQMDLTKKSPAGPSATDQTYRWWCSVKPYPGKWNDMHAIACTWRMTRAKDQENFRKMVSRVCKRATAGHTLESSLESVLSLK